MAKALLPLCSIPKVATRDGWTGSLARLFLPFYQYGYWFASGQQYAWPSATVQQNQSLTMTGTAKPNNFIKAPGICLNG